MKHECAPDGLEGARAYRTPAIVASVLAGALFAALLLTDPLLHAQHSGSAFRVTSYNFYDVQAHSFLHLHWYVPRNSVGLEGWVVHGRTYEYYGPFPALLRLPLAAFDVDLGGRFGQASMLVAFVLLLFFTTRLARRIRPLVRGAAPVTPGERIAIGCLIFLTGAGSVVLFLASRAWVYHEAVLWGAALALVAFDFVLTFALQPTAKHLLLASAAITLCFQARGTMAVGPLLALATLVAAVFVPRLRDGVGLGAAPKSAAFAVLSIAAVGTPVVLYCAVNYAKFGMPFSLPWQAHLARELPVHAAFLKANGGSMLHAKFVPSTLCQFLRPDALVPTGSFPWLRFSVDATPCGLVPVETSPTSSIPTSMPALLVLAVIGAIGAIRGSRMRDTRLQVVRPLLLGAVVGLLPTLTFGYIANRYLTDCLPGLIVAAVPGLHLTLRWSSKRRWSVVSQLAWSGIALLAVASIWSNFSTALLYGRDLEAHTPTYTRLEFEQFRHDVDDVLSMQSGHQR